jgi:hypothetical protein
VDYELYRLLVLGYWPLRDRAGAMWLTEAVPNSQWSSANNR